MFLFGLIADQPVEWLVDTGCSTTILASHKWDQLPGAVSSSLRRDLLSADSTHPGMRNDAEPAGANSSSMTSSSPASPMRDCWGLTSSTATGS